MARISAWSGTARRLALAFASILTVFAVTSWFALSGLSEVHEGVHRMKEHEQGARLALELASAVRDHYAHQAHTIIIGDQSHLAYYGEASEHVLSLIAQVRKSTHHPQALAWIDEIERASRELDGIFRERIVPAVMEGDQEKVQAEHDRAQEIVSLIQEKVEELVLHFEADVERFDEQVQVVEHTTFRWTLAMLLGAFALAAAIGVYIGRSVAVPIGKLHEGAERLARGDLETRIALDTPDEFGQLAHHFNAMTASLKEHQQRLVQSEKLAGVGRLAAGVAHEINNPLGVILGYTRLLRKKADGAMADDLKVIEDETLRCKDIVEGLLDLSRPMPGDPEPVELRALCDEVVERLEQTAQASRAQIAVDGSAQVVGYPNRLRQVLLNLIKNAAEAAGPGGSVRVQVGGGDGSARVTVADSGPGIAPEAYPRLFEPFFTTKASGTGLGLAVSQAIARAHGGGIDAAPAASGAGAVFTLNLPAHGPPTFRPVLGKEARP